MLGWLKDKCKNLTGFIRFISNFGIFNFMWRTAMGMVKGIHPRVIDVRGFPIICDGNEEKYRAMIDDLVALETREDDIFVVAYPKAGQHWSYDFINMILKGNLDLDNSIKETTFLEVFAGFHAGYSSLHALPSPRVLFTHWSACVLPKEVFTKKRKVIRIIRNPKDTYVSAFYHYNQMVVERGTGAKDLQWHEFIEGAMGMIEGHVDPDLQSKPFIGEGQDWFKYELDCEEKLNHLDHVLVLYYEDLKEDMPLQMKKLATFLGKSYDEDFYEKIAARTNLAYVLKNKDLSMHNAFYKKEGGLYRKGVIGDWKNHFTIAQNARFDDIARRQLEGSSIVSNIRYEAKQ